MFYILNMKNLDLRLYFVANATKENLDTLKRSVEQALLGGVTALQLRAKNLEASVVLSLSKELKDLCDAKNIPFLINDRVDIALKIHTSGVHLGQNDMPIATARKLLRERAIIGISAGNITQAQLAEQNGADYIGVGPVFPTTSKVDAGATIGLLGLSQIRKSVHIPIVAIGGINAFKVSKVMKHGASGIAVISAIQNAVNPRKATEKLLEIIEKPRLNPRG